MPFAAYLGSGIAALLVVEALTNAVLRRGLYELRDTLQNLKMAVGNVGPALAARLVALPIAWGLYQLRIWDRVYGTLQPETVRPSFGLVHPLPSESMTTVQFGTWRRLLRGVAAASSLRQGLGRLFGPPC